MVDLPSESVSRRLTLRAILDAAMEGGLVSRSQLARATGLSKQTMSDAFRDLENDGWIEASGQARGGIGRSATTYRLAPGRAFVFGADVGGTNIRAALADLNGAIVAERTEPTDPRGGDQVIAQIQKLSEALCHSAQVSPDRVLVGSIGVPGAFNPSTGHLAIVPNIAGWEGTPLQERLSSRLRFEVQIGNDVNMAAKGEQWRGEGRGLSSFVFIALGTGIGMGIISDGRILPGAHGAAGEIGTLPIGADPFDSRNWRSGALESMIGAAAIRDRYRSFAGSEVASVREIMDRLSQGDAGARATLDEVARNLAVAILAIAAVIDPERVILGGSIGERPELLERVVSALALCTPRPPSCTISTLGNLAGLHGTIAQGLDFVRQTMFDPPRRLRGVAQGVLRARAG